MLTMGGTGVTRYNRHCPARKRWGEAPHSHSLLKNLSCYTVYAPKGLVCVALRVCFVPEMGMLHGRRWLQQLGRQGEARLPALREGHTLPPQRARLMPSMS